eukprot:13489256-Alexandrium_andersonii.AAC.1
MARPRVRTRTTARARTRRASSSSGRTTARDVSIAADPTTRLIDRPQNHVNALTNKAGQDPPPSAGISSGPKPEANTDSKNRTVGHIGGHEKSWSSACSAAAPS